MDKKILNKINKLIALTSSSNEHESAKAAEMAFKLMEQYNILSSDLNALKLENDLGPIDKQETDTSTKMPIWKKQLASVIANKFSCVSYTSKKYLYEKGWFVYSTGFIGHESNRITSQIMFEWLAKIIQKEANKKFTTYGQRMSFCIGAVQALNEKYCSEESVDGSNETGLVIYDEVQNWIKDNMNMKKSRSQVPSVQSGAYSSGKEMGKDLSLNKQFGLKAISA